MSVFALVHIRKGGHQVQQ